MTALFGPQNANAATTLPAGTATQRYGGIQSWVRDCSAPGMNDGTILDAAFYNRLIGNLEYLVNTSDIIALPGDMTTLYRAVLGAVAGEAPLNLRTFQELAAAIDNDPTFYQTVAAALANRLRIDGPQILNPAQIATIKSNLSLANVAFSGSYLDLRNPPNFGTAALLNAGSAPFNVLRLDASGRIPAVDGSRLTNLTYTSLIGVPVLGTAAALDVGTTAGKIVQLDVDDKLPAVDGSRLINLPSGGGSGGTGATGPGYGGTSVTSATPALASQTLMTQAGMAYEIGSRIRATSVSTPAVWMEGVITSYTASSMVFTPDLIGTATAKADWALSLAGQPGVKGDTGTAGTPGAAGAKGDKGDTGSTGSTGASGTFPIGGGLVGTYALSDASAPYQPNGSSTYPGSWALISGTPEGVQLMQRVG